MTWETFAEKTLVSVASLCLQFHHDLTNEIGSQSALFPINVLSLNLICNTLLKLFLTFMQNIVIKQTSFSFTINSTLVCWIC